MKRLLLILALILPLQGCVGLIDFIADETIGFNTQDVGDVMFGVGVAVDIVDIINTPSKASTGEIQYPKDQDENARSIRNQSIILK